MQIENSTISVAVGAGTLGLQALGMAVNWGIQKRAQQENDRRLNVLEEDVKKNTSAVAKIEGWFAERFRNRAAAL